MRGPCRRAATGLAVLALASGAAVSRAAASPPVTAPGATSRAPNLSDDRLAGQRIVTAFRGTTLTPWLAARIRQGRIAGVILFGSNIAGTAATRALVRRIAAVPRPHGLTAPLLVMVDQEGGAVRRLPGPLGSAASTPSAAAARARGRSAGRALRSVGANVDLAPVADVGRPGGFVRAQGRSYGAGPAAVAARASAFAAGLREVGVAPCAKHFPGLGAAAVNTDRAPSVVRMSARVLRAVDERPFTRLVRDRVPLVMMSSATYPAIARGPAVRSARLVTGELRERLGFRGVVMTDSLAAGALRPGGGAGSAAVAASRAGVDLMLAASETSADAVRRALVSAERDGRLLRSAARRSVARILALRASLPGPS